MNTFWKFVLLLALVGVVPGSAWAQDDLFGDDAGGDLFGDASGAADDNPFGGPEDKDLFTGAADPFGDDGGGDPFDNGGADPFGDDGGGDLFDNGGADPFADDGGDDPFAPDPFGNSTNPRSFQAQPFFSGDPVRLAAEKVQNAEYRRHAAKLQQLRAAYLNEKDKTKRKAISKQIEKQMEVMFQADYKRREQELRQLEERVAKLRAAQDRRKASKDRVIRVRMEQMLLDAEGLSFPLGRSAATFSQRAAATGRYFTPDDGSKQGDYQIESDKKQPDGSRLVTILMVRLQPETRRREVPYTVMVPQTRQRIVNGEEQAYTVTVPETRTRTESYTVMVPTQEKLEFRVAKGETIDQAVEKLKQEKPEVFRGTRTGRTRWNPLPVQPELQPALQIVSDEKLGNGNRRVTVVATGTRAESRTREVPYTVMISKGGEKLVPEVRSRTENYTVHVPFQEIVALEVGDDQTVEEAFALWNDVTPDFPDPFK